MNGLESELDNEEYSDGGNKADIRSSHHSAFAHLCFMSTSY